jgi:hypothetical protein
MEARHSPVYIRKIHPISYGNILGPLPLNRTLFGTLFDFFFEAAPDFLAARILMGFPFTIDIKSPLMLPNAMSLRFEMSFCSVLRPMPVPVRERLEIHSLVSSRSTCPFAEGYAKCSTRFSTGELAYGGGELVSQRPRPLTPRGIFGGHIRSVYSDLVWCSTNGERAD